MTTETVAATANVLRTLGRDDANASLEAVLALEPDLVGLQEWGWRRRTQLPRRDYAWAVVRYGENPVGARRDRYRVLGSRLRILGWVAPADRGARPLPVLPPRVATVVVLRDLLLDRTVSVVNFHLVPGVQSRGAYRADRPLLVARHSREVSRLRSLTAEQQASGHVTFAVGDSNFHGLHLPGLTSAWQGREHVAGTFGARRRIDDVFGPGPASDVTLVDTASDHRAVVARRPDAP